MLSAAPGLAAALPGVVAAHTDLPVIGVPLRSSKSVLDGLDALLSIVQMPPGVPVATRRRRQREERRRARRADPRCLTASSRELVAELVAIDSVNPALVRRRRGRGGGRALRRAVARARPGSRSSVDEAAPGRPNVVGVARGRGGGRTLLLNGHLDTVGTPAWSGRSTPRVDGGRLFGRGAYDMKGGLAAAMLAGAEAAHAGLRGDVVVAAVVDEELARVGTEALLGRVARRCGDRLRADRAARRGRPPRVRRLRDRDARRRRARLAARPRRRRDREDGPVLVELAELDERLQPARPHPLVGTGSLHASLIEGGQELSSYPAGAC